MHQQIIAVVMMYWRNHGQIMINKNVMALVPKLSEHPSYIPYISPQLFHYFIILNVHGRAKSVWEYTNVEWLFKFDTWWSITECSLLVWCVSGRLVANNSHPARCLHSSIAILNSVNIYWISMYTHCHAFVNKVNPDNAAHIDTAWSGSNLFA